MEMLPSLKAVNQIPVLPRGLAAASGVHRGPVQVNLEEGQLKHTE